jgi:hypothetical protein
VLATGVAVAASGSIIAALEGRAMSKRRRRKCLNCGALYRPDPRNLRHQRYCSQPACRRASKAASQQRWLAKGANRDYFRGPEQVARVRDWRAAHPGYWRQSTSPLQEHSLTQVSEPIEKTASLAGSPLQDLSHAQPLVLIGLIAHLTGAALQEDIALASSRFQALAHDILHATTARDPRDRAR